MGHLLLAEEVSTYLSCPGFEEEYVGQKAACSRSKTLQERALSRAPAVEMLQLVLRNQQWEEQKARGWGGFLCSRVRSVGVR